jgi:hypothetical protein
LRVTYGLWLDGNRIPTLLAYNGAVDSVFHPHRCRADDAARVRRASFQWASGTTARLGIPGYGAP